MYTAGLDMVTFTLIIDDIVFPDGQTLMGALGGGGTSSQSKNSCWKLGVLILGRAVLVFPPLLALRILPVA